MNQIEEYSRLPRITSDCRSFPSGGVLYLCGTCGLLQKVPDERWLAEIAEIYSGYSAYAIADGDEQVVFDPDSGAPKRRSDLLMSKLASGSNMNDQAVVLDVGCGHGVTLRSMGAAFPSWILNGYELDKSNQPLLNEIKGFAQLYTGEIKNIKSRFDFISMIHSLEHFSDPLGTLRALQSILKPNGRIFIEVCNELENPFDLLVADHLTHFSPDTLVRMVNAAGLVVEEVQTKWVKKEISLLARNVGVQPLTDLTYRHDTNNDLARLRSSISWLGNLIEKVSVMAKSHKEFGLFGTSIASTWLSAALPSDSIRFYVDEDPSRIGKLHRGKQVISPEQVPNSAYVLMPLAPSLAKEIATKLGGVITNLIRPN